LLSRRQKSGRLTIGPAARLAAPGVTRSIGSLGHGVAAAALRSHALMSMPWSACLDQHAWASITAPGARIASPGSPPRQRPAAARTRL